MGCGGVKRPALVLSSSKGDRVRKGLLEEKAAAGSIIMLGLIWWSWRIKMLLMCE